jgi:Skp family chaperone for outer membrane proteins
LGQIIPSAHAWAKPALFGLTCSDWRITTHLSLSGKWDGVICPRSTEASIAGPGPLVSANLDEEKRTVKRKVIALAGLVTLAAAAYFGNRIAAQTPAPAPATPPRPLQTRIGLLNMVQVLKNYKKFQAMEETIKKRATDLEKTLEPYRTEMVRLREQLNNPKLTQDERDKIERRAQQVQLDARQKEDDAKKELIKMNGDAAVQIYKEVEDAVNVYAHQSNLELVMFYNDAITAEDFYHPANLQRKLTQPAAVMPMFVTPGMDISNQIVTALNAKYGTAASATPPATTGTHN